MRPLDAAYDPGKTRRHRHQSHRAAPVETAGPAAAQVKQAKSAALPPVLYIHPAKQGPDFSPEADTGRPYGLIPLGLPALVNVLRAAGIGVKGVIHPLEKQLDPSFRLQDWLSLQRQARVILIDLHWYEHCYGAVETARLCKKVLPSAWTVLGGLSASGFAREILENFPQVDFVIRGDAEKPLLQLVQYLLSQGNSAGDMAVAGLESIPNLSYRAAGGLPGAGEVPSVDSSGAASGAAASGAAASGDSASDAATSGAATSGAAASGDSASGDASGAASANATAADPAAVIEAPTSYLACTEDLDRLDFVNLDFLEHSHEYFAHEYIVTNLYAARQALEKDPFLGRWTCTARGCKYNCSYCGGSKESHRRLAGRNGIIPRSPERVVDDLQRLQQKGVIQASLSYDIAVLGEEYWRKFFSLLRESRVNIGVYNEFFQIPTREFIEDYARSVMMAQSCVALSPLSGSERVRRLNGKHYSNDQLFDILDALSQKRFYLFVYFSLNLPGETAETFEETLELAKSIYDFYPTSLLKILNTVHTIDPVSPMNLYPEKYGVTASMSTFMDFYNYCRDTRQAGPGARTGSLRGFNLSDPSARSLQAMANAWDRARVGREAAWWPVPPSW